MKEYEIRQAGRCAHLNMEFHENKNGHIMVRLGCVGGGGECGWKFYCIKLLKPAEDELNIGKPLKVEV